MAAQPSQIIAEEMIAEGRSELVSDPRVMRAIAIENGWKVAEPRWTENWRSSAIAGIAMHAEDAQDIARYGLVH